MNDLYNKCTSKITVEMPTKYGENPNFIMLACPLYMDWEKVWVLSSSWYWISDTNTRCDMWTSVYEGNYRLVAKDCYFQIIFQLRVSNRKNTYNSLYANLGHAPSIKFFLTIVHDCLYLEYVQQLGPQFCFLYIHWMSGLPSIKDNLIFVQSGMSSWTSKRSLPGTRW